MQGQIIHKLEYMEAIRTTLIRLFKDNCAVKKIKLGMVYQVNEKEAYTQIAIAKPMMDWDAEICVKFLCTLANDSVEAFLSYENQNDVDVFQTNRVYYTLNDAFAVEHNLDTKQLT